MPNQSVRAGVDDAMAFLAGDGVRPEAPEMNARPPGEQATGGSEHSQDIGAGGADLPQRLLAKDGRGPRRQQDGADQDGDSVRPRVPCSHMLLGTPREERTYQPAQKPRRPDQRQ